VQRSLLNPNVNAIDYKLTNLLSISATQESIHTLDYARHHYNGPDYPLGLRMANANAKRRTLTDWVSGGHVRLILPEGIEKSDRWPLSDARFEALSALLADAGRAGVKVDVVQLPMHAVALESYFAAGRWPMYERWVATLTRVVADHNEKFPGSPVTFWNFCNYDSFTTDPALNTSVWYYDPFHITIPLGDLVLDRIMRFPPPPGTDLTDFGLMMTPANLDSHLARLKHDHQAYYDANPQIEQFHQLIRATLAKRDSGQ
jgi:hypothetical protein